MNLALFLRGANVGGARVFSPAALAKKLGVESIGAAGTFIARNASSAGALRKKFAAALPFKTEILVCSAADIAGLVDADPFRNLPKDAKPVVTILAQPPKSPCKFPFDLPAGPKWQVRLFPPVGLFVPGCYRVLGRLGHYPNEVAEKTLGVPATTRGWPTILKIHDKLRSWAVPRNPPSPLRGFGGLRSQLLPCAPASARTLRCRRNPCRFPPCPNSRNSARGRSTKR